MTKKIIKWGLIVVLSGIVIGGGYGLYLFNMPHRDVQSTEIDFKIDAKQLVAEYLLDATSANGKYLEEEGESSILEVTGTVFSIETDMNKQKVILLKNKGDKAGVSCTFMQATNVNAEKLLPGQKVSIKGVIRSGAGYDEDLDLYEDVILEKCDVLTK